MAYTDDDKKNNIIEIQKYLRGISRYNGNIPLVIPSGVYDDRTEQAVMQFQREYGLPVTGKVDRMTWEKIYELYLAAEEYYTELVSILPFPNADYSLKEGSSGFEIYILQAMLNTIFSLYSNIAPIKIDGSYGRETADAIRMLQKIIGEEGTGNVDYKTWNKLAHLYNFHAVPENNGTSASQ